uniref:Uncharacterized protein n=1 Tax=Mustela putorius furo TaxID=9669 RepID=M3YJI1_MUSPF
MSWGQMQRTDPGRGEAGDQGVMPSVPLQPSHLGPVGRPGTPPLCVLACTTRGCTGERSQVQPGPPAGPSGDQAQPRRQSGP